MIARSKWVTPDHTAAVEPGSHTERIRDTARLGSQPDHAEILRLSAEVIRTRTLVTVDRLQAGWRPPDDILKHLTVDEQLLREHDDAGLT